MAPPVVVTIFVPGKLENPLSGRAGLRGHWSKHARWAKSRKEKAEMCILHALGSTRMPWPAATPKRVTFTAFVGAEWDIQDNLRAALKPSLDALVTMGMLNSDKPSAGHEFIYRQEIRRGQDAQRGVRIEVEEGPGG